MGFNVPSSGYSQIRYNAISAFYWINFFDAQVGCRLWVVESGIDVKYRFEYAIRVYSARYPGGSYSSFDTVSPVRFNYEDAHWGTAVWNEGNIYYQNWSNWGHTANSNYINVGSKTLGGYTINVDVTLPNNPGQVISKGGSSNRPSWVVPNPKFSLTYNSSTSSSCTFTINNAGGTTFDNHFYYNVFFNESKKMSGCTRGSTYTVYGLASNTNYTVRVEAYWGGNYGTWSAGSTSFNFTTLGIPPSNLVLTVPSVNWQAFSTNLTYNLNGIALSKIIYKLSGIWLDGTNQTLTVESTTSTGVWWGQNIVPGKSVRPATYYALSAQVVNVQGYSDIVYGSLTTDTQPPEVTAITASNLGHNNTYTVKYNIYVGLRSIQFAYKKADGIDTYHYSPVQTSSSILYTDFGPKTTYNIWCKVIDSSGKSSEMTITNTTVNWPPVITGLEFVERGYDYLLAVVSYTSEAGIDHIIYELRQGSVLIETQTLNTARVKFSNLEPHTTYSLKVTVVDKWTDSDTMTKVSVTRDDRAVKVITSDGNIEFARLNVIDDKGHRTIIYPELLHALK